MPRLRITAALSVLALLIGIWGTDWLSGFTDDWIGPPPRPAAQAAARAHRAPVRHRAHAAPRVVGAQPEAAPHPVPVASPALVPLDTPPGPSSWVQLRGHLDGRVVLDVATDGTGQVTAARVARSSGDPVLDAHAVATVQRWRFAVPAGAAGVQGELPMRFDSRAPSTPP
ncbi:energy transducer TonB family protein [Frateuria terrea]|uniref:Protein TonB n=1 Tax=Frateuria terrea TaxID=529704 RepID=A0A1H6T0A0_9GAMM|nr:energy transducer TonB [Frateuria terrea]SEI73533.1 protein TonB [Frateuria terrea]SFP29812.1 protein TonB [Frateuria terrea]